MFLKVMGIVRIRSKLFKTVRLLAERLDLTMIEKLERKIVFLTKI